MGTLSRPSHQGHNELRDCHRFLGEIMPSKLARSLPNRARNSIPQIKLYTMFLHEIVVLCRMRGVRVAPRLIPG